MRMRLFLRGYFSFKLFDVFEEKIESHNSLRYLRILENYVDILLCYYEARKILLKNLSSFGEFAGMFIIS